MICAGIDLHDLEGVRLKSIACERGKSILTATVSPPQLSRTQLEG